MFYVQCFSFVEIIKFLYNRLDEKAKKALINVK